MKQLGKIAFSLAAVAAATCAWADVIDEDPDYYTETVEGVTWEYVIEDGDYNGAMIIGVETAPTGPVAIPDSLGNMTVVGLDYSALKGCAGITSVTVPDCVEYINYQVFNDCTGLTTVDLGGSTADIGPGAFAGCNSLKNFVVSDYNSRYKVESGMLVTKQENVLKCGVNGAVTIPSDVETIGQRAFYRLGGLTSVKISAGVTFIGEMAFDGCGALASVTIPDSVVAVEQWAFEDCKSSLYDTKTIPGVKLVDGWVVDYASSLSGALNLAGIRGIASGAFYGCEGLTSVTLPNGLVYIPEYAFQSCENLATITIPKSVLAIAQEAFDDDNGLKTVWVEKGDVARVKSLFDDAGIDVDEGAFKEIATAFKLTLKSSNTQYGTVSGSGTYDEGTKVTIKASAKSGYGFAGWYTDKACTKPLNPPGYDNRRPTVKITMPSKNKTIYAKFITKADDKKALKVPSATKKLANTPVKVTAHDRLSLYLDVQSATLLSFSSTTIPKGLKLDARTGAITGNPSVPGSYAMSVKVKTAAGNSTTLKVLIKVVAPKWAVGTFQGYVFPEGASKPGGVLVFTAKSNGEISGKVTYKRKVYKFTSKYTYCDWTKAEFTPPSLKLGSKTFKPGLVTVTEEELEFEGNGGPFMVVSNADGTFFAQKPFKFVASNGYLGAINGKTYKFTSSSNSAGAELSGSSWLKVKLQDDLAAITGKVDGKSFILAAPLNYISKKHTSGSSIIYKFRVYIYDSGSGYRKWVVFTMKTESDKKMSKIKSGVNVLFQK